MRKCISLTDKFNKQYKNYLSLLLIAYELISGLSRLLLSMKVQTIRIQKQTKMLQQTAWPQTCGHTDELWQTHNKIAISPVGNWYWLTSCCVNCSSKTANQKMAKILDMEV